MSLHDNASGKGKLFVLSAPSGCGKTTLTRRLLGDNELNLIQSVSVTTRKPRKDEKNGVDYRFVSEREFRRRLERKAFLEWEENFGYRYGTPRQRINSVLQKGRSILLSIDVKGAMSVKKAYPGRSILVFISPPSLRVLSVRLKRRRTDSSYDIARRLREAKRELSFRKKYNYVVVNDKLDNAYERLKKIILSEINKR